MTIKISKYFKKKISKEIKKEVLKTAQDIENYLNGQDVYRRIKKANTKGTSSQIIQEIIEEIATPLGFSDEKQGLFKKYEDSGMRPDFYKKLKFSVNGITMQHFPIY